MKQEPGDSEPIEFNMRDKMAQLSADVLRVLGPLVKRFDDLVTTDRILREGRESGDTPVRKYAKRSTRPQVAGARKGSYRDAVLDILRASAAPLTMSDIIERLGVRGITPASRGSLSGMLSTFVKTGQAHWDRPSPEERRLGVETTWRTAQGAIPSAQPAPAPAPPTTSGAPSSINEITINALREIGQPATKADIVRHIIDAGVLIPGGSSAPVDRRVGWSLTAATTNNRVIKKGSGTNAIYRLK